MLATPVQAERVVLDDDLIVDYQPESLTLKPRERGTFELYFTNSGNETLFVALTQMVLKSPGASRAFINPDFFELVEGESQMVVVIIQSANDYHEEGTSDSHIAIAWGHNLTPADGHNLSLVVGRVKGGTVEGGTKLILPVTDDLSLPDQIRTGLIILGVVVAIGISVVVLNKTKGKDASTGRNKLR
jgi:hypothetical protein